VGHRGQDRDLVLAPGRPVGPGPLARAPDLEPAAVDRDDRQRRPGLDARLQRAGAESVHRLIAVGPELRADLVGDAAELPAADAHLGQLGHRLGRRAEGGLPRGAADELAEHRGAEVMGRQPQRRPLREKNPGGRPGSGPRARRR
jgi:hypothetical protein